MTTPFPTGDRTGGTPRRGRRQPQPPQPEPTEPREGFTALARVIRPHGLRGELRVHAFNPDAPHLQEGAEAWIGPRQTTVTRSRPDKGAWILELAAITSRTEAESLRGALIEAPDSAIHRGPGEHFIYELIGLRVETAEGRLVGTITDVLQPGANDVYVVTTDTGEVLIPVVADVVQRIDPLSGLVVITPLAGMLDESGY
ncbi:MAG: ribosome maturation factor RimM [Dehalococcoidia bacterium]